MKSLTQVLSQYKTADPVMADAVLSQMSKGHSLSQSVRLAKAQRRMGVKEAMNNVVEARSKVTRFLLPRLKASEIKKVEDMIESYKEAVFDFKEAQFRRSGLSKTSQVGKAKIEKEYV